MHVVQESTKYPLNCVNNGEENFKKNVQKIQNEAMISYCQKILSEKVKAVLACNMFIKNTHHQLVTLFREAFRTDVLEKIYHWKWSLFSI